MTQNEPWEDDLLKERSLTQVFIGSQQISKSPFNTATRWVAGIGAAAYVIVNSLWFADNEPILAAIVRTAGIIVGVAATVLGFLIAGFSIFASMANKSLFKGLAQAPHQDTGLSELKYVFFNFINVFSVYLILLVASGSLLFLAPLGPRTPLDAFVSVGPRFIVGLNSAILAAFMLLCVESALRLKSFIWSFYQSVLIAIILAPESGKSDEPGSEKRTQQSTPDREQTDQRVLTTTTH